MDRHSFNLKIKAVDDSGTFTGIGAVYGNTDLGGDKILPGAFNRSLAAGKQFPLLWQHDPSQPIGTVRAQDSPQGLQVEGKLLLEDPTARKAYNFLKAGVLKGLSIGYDTLKSTFVGDVRELSEVRLWEVSVVTFPMNTEAMVTAVKAVSDMDRAKHFKAIDFHRKAIDRHQRAQRQHLKALFDGFDDDGEVDPAEDPSLVTLADDPDMEQMSATIEEMKRMFSLASS